MNKYIIKFKNILTLQNILITLVFLSLIPLPLFNVPWSGIDPSWQISINLAIKEHLIFGKEHIFTYGPLGYLQTRIPVYASKTLILLFELFVILNACYFIHYLTKELSKKSALKKIHFAFLLAIFLLLGIPVFHPGASALYFYFTFYLFLFLKRRNILSLILASACCLLAFYIKVNMGIVVNFIFFIAISYFILTKFTTFTKGLLILLAHFTILYLISFILNTDFILYIRNSLHIINSYNDAMFLPATAKKLIEALLVVALLLSPLIIQFKRLTISRNDLFILFNILVMIYITFKQGFVRADLEEEHIVAFFNIISFIAILGYLFTEAIKSKVNFYLYLLPIVILSIIGTEFKTIKKNRHFISDEIENIIHPAAKNSALLNAGKNRKLPDNIVKEVDNKTIDVMSYEISYVYFNNMTYDPRPVIQSYSAYDSSLININANKYNSASAPDYVLFHCGSIDRRYYFWDEPKTYLPLLTRYEIFDTIHQTNLIGSMILFKKLQTPKQMSERMVVDTVIHFNSKVAIPNSDNILFLTVDYNYTLAGKIRRFLFQPAEVIMNVFYGASDSTRSRLVMPVMASGVPINHKVIDFKDVYKFFASKGKENKKSTAFELSGNPLWMNDSFRIRLTEYTIGQ